MPKDSGHHVSCIIPAHNAARYIAAAIESALTQTEPPLEVVVVDDESTDDTARIVRSFGETVMLIQQERAGVSAARNLGISRAHGDLLCFLDADDRFDAEKLARQRECFQTRPELEFCDARSRYFWSEELTAADLSADPRYTHDFWHTEAAGHISSWLVKRAVFERIGLFDEQLHFSEDTDWRLRFEDSGGLVETLARVVSERRLHPANATASNRDAQVRGLAMVIQRSRARRDRVRDRG